MILYYSFFFFSHFFFLAFAISLFSYLLLCVDLIFTVAIPPGNSRYILSLQVESEVTELRPEERTEYLKSLGVNESGLGNLIRATYDLLGLRTYFTTGEKVMYWSSIDLFCLTGYPSTIYWIVLV